MSILARMHRRPMPGGGLHTVARIYTPQPTPGSAPHAAYITQSASWTAALQVLATIEAPPTMATRGEGSLVEARVCRVIRRSGSGETDAIRVSESLPFIEYELQRQLMLKLKVRRCCKRRM